MKIPELLEQISGYKRVHDQVFYLLGNLQKLDQDRTLNLKQIKAQLLKLEKLANDSRENQPTLKELLESLAEYQKEIEALAKKTETDFGSTLEKELQIIGHSLSGHYPLLSAGLFRIEVDFRSWSIKLWYGPKQELLDRCPISAQEVTRRLEILKPQLGSNLEESAFSQTLFSAYSRVLNNNLGEPAPIIKVLNAFAEAINETKQAKQYSKGKVPIYNRQDFSYDLFRLRGANLGLKLVVATKAFSKRRQDFLWIPSDESGNGSIYSHLKFPEVK